MVLVFGAAELVCFSFFHSLWFWHFRSSFRFKQMPTHLLPPPLSPGGGGGGGGAGGALEGVGKQSVRLLIARVLSEYFIILFAENAFSFVCLNSSVSVF